MNADVKNISEQNSGSREVIFVDKAPEPLGTYSQGIKVGNMIFLAAQTPVVPETGEVALGGFEG